MSDKCPGCQSQVYTGTANLIRADRIGAVDPDVVYACGAYDYRGDHYQSLDCLRRQLAQRDKQLAAAQAENKRLRAIVDRLIPLAAEVVREAYGAAEAAKAKGDNPK